MGSDQVVKRNILSVIVFFIGVGFSLASHSAITNWTEGEARLEFQKAASNRVAAIQREVDADLASLKALAAMFRSFDQVSSSEFTEFAQRVLEDETIESMSWVPKVDSDERDFFVKSARRTLPYFEIHDGSGNTVEGRRTYFPVFYKIGGSAEELGEDLAYKPEIKEALDEAGSSDQMVATSRIKLKGDEGSYGFIVYIPIFKNDGSYKKLLGFARGVFDIEALVQQSGKYLDETDVRLKLLDLLAQDPADQLLYNSHKSDADYGDKFRIIQNIRLAKRTWKAVCVPADAPLQRPWQANLVLGFGILISAIFASYLRSLAGRTSQVEQLVELRTAELAEQVSERQEALRRLRRSEEQYRELFEQSQALIWTHSEDGTIRTINPAAANSLGYKPSEMVGENLRSFVIPTERHRFQKYLDRAITSSSDKGLLKLYTKNGATRFWMYHNNAEPDEDSVYVRCHALDVTENQQAERELARLNRKNQLILDSVGEGIYGINLAGECSFANPAAQIHTGYSQTELVAADKTVHEILLHTDQKGRPYNWEDSPTYATLQDGKIRRVTDELMWTKEGGQFPVDYVVTPIIEEDERILGAVVTFQDITERRAIETMKNEFISIVSHELRTPLTSIRGSLGLLASGMLKKFPEKAESMIKIAVENTDRLVRLINDILDIERLESGKVTIEKAPQELKSLMEQAADTMKAMADKAKVTLKTVPLEETVLADSDRILQVLTNLLSNAIKFSPPEGEVTLFGERREEDVLVAVRDVGRGIPEEKLDKIFERFGQVDASDSREKGGTGLGLPICKTIIEQHGGKLWVESTLGEGSTFCFTIPHETAAADSSEEAQEEQSKEAASVD